MAAHSIRAHYGFPTYRRNMNNDSLRC